MIQGMAAHSVWFEYLLDALGGNIYQSTDRNVYVYRGMECFTIVLFLSDSSRTVSGSRILPNILDFVKESDVECQTK